MELQVIKKADDISLGINVIRISIGGTMEHGLYITYRGNLDEVKKVLALVTQNFLTLTDEPSISPDDGKKYA